MFTSSEKRRLSVKALSVLSALAIVFVILSSLSYITEHADHCCEGQHCSVCDSIRQCFDNLKTGADPEVSVFAAVMALTAAVYLFCIGASNDTAVTLVTQKVRLNN